MSVNWAPSDFRDPSRGGRAADRSQVRSTARPTGATALGYRVELVEAARDGASAAERRELARRSLTRHPFQLPGFEDTAPGRLAPANAKRLQVRDSAGRLMFSSPVTVRSLPLVGRHMTFGFWSIHYAPLGGPLIDADEAAAVLRHLFAWLGKRFRIRSLAFPFLRLKDPFAELLEAEAEAAGLTGSTANRHARAALHGPQDAESFFNRTVSKKRRKEFARLLRRLGDEGAVGFDTVREPAAVEAALERFLDLEAAGWKGRAGTALKRSGNRSDFVRAAVAALAAEGHVHVDQLKLDGRPIAQLVRFSALGEAVAWKIAFDESLGSFSPGVLLMIEVLSKCLDDPAIRRTDSLAIENHPMIDHIWRSRETIGDMRVALGWRGRVGLALFDLAAAGRKRARSLVLRLIGRRQT